jgi:hypothetical protein
MMAIKNMTDVHHGSITDTYEQYHLSILPSSCGLESEPISLHLTNI